MIKYQTQLTDFPVVLAPYSIEEGEIIEIQDESKGIMLFKVSSVKDGELYLKEVNPILVQSNF